MIDLERFKFKLSNFPPDYMLDFDCFWRWNLKVETEGGHVLDESHRRDTYNKLRVILARWQAYRSSHNSDPWKTLEQSLKAISDVYNQLRVYPLLEFNKIPNHLLELVWHELGRVKEYNANMNDACCYYIVSVCKPHVNLGTNIGF